MYASEFKSLVVDRKEYLMTIFSSDSVAGSPKKLMHNYVLTPMIMHSTLNQQ
jgi:hypothetical protein